MQKIINKKGDLQGLVKNEIHRIYGEVKMIADS
jgi:hypothetical protein